MSILSRKFSHISSKVVSCVTTEAAITEPSHLDISPSLCSVHIDCKQLGNVLFQSIGIHFPNQNFKLGHKILHRLPFELFSLASSKELDIPWQFLIQLN